jgi:hypothetical protein
MVLLIQYRYHACLSKSRIRRITSGREIKLPVPRTMLSSHGMKRAGFLHWANTSRLLAVVRLDAKAIYHIINIHIGRESRKKTLLNGFVSMRI